MTQPASTRGPVWRQLHFPRPLRVEPVLRAVHAWAADPTSPRIVLETRADQSGIRYLLGTTSSQLGPVSQRLSAVLPQLELTTPTAERCPVGTAAGLHLSTRHRPLSPDAVEPLTRQLHAALTQLRGDESAVLQILLGPRRIPLSVPNQSPSSIVMPWWQTALYGDRGRVDPEKRAALRSKVSIHGFAASVRLGVSAASRKRRSQLITHLFAAIRLAEAPGLKASLRSASPGRIDSATAPLLWQLRLNAAEVVALAGWPIGDDFGRVES